MSDKSGSSEDDRSSTDIRKPWRIWREPLIHFFILGMAVFALHAALDRKPETDAVDPRVVEVSSADIEWMRTIFTKQMGREPTIRDLRMQVNQLIREQILSREAVAIGLDEGDIVVRRRLAQKMEFLFKDLAGLREPTEEELRTYFTKNQKKYETLPTISFTHVYFSADSRGVEGATQAAQTIIQDNGDPGDAMMQGDTSILSPTCTQCSSRQIKDRFGTDFTEQIQQLSPGAWHGPVRSAYGVHAVYVHDRQDASLPDLKEIQNRVKDDWMSVKREETTRKAYGDIRSQYQVLVEGLPYELDWKG